MTDIMRVRTVISGWQGAPGLGTHYFRPPAPTAVTADAVDVAGRVRAFWAAAAALFTTTVGFQVSGAVDLIEDSTGKLTGGLSGGSPAGSSGSSGTQMLSLASMLLLRQQTGVIINGRRVQGHWNMGPLAVTTDATGGVPTAAAGTTALTAANSLLSGATGSIPVVWHRPKGTPPAGGLAVQISGFQVGPVFAILRSRRD